VLFIQFNNVTPEKWCLIKEELLKLGLIKILRVKNKLASKILKELDYKQTLTTFPPTTLAESQNPGFNLKQFQSSSHNNRKLFINEIFQGPTLILACPIVEQLPGIYTILEKNPNLLFIGGLFEKQVITHLDFKKIVDLDNSVFTKLIAQCSSPINSFFCLKSLIDLRCFNAVQKSLLHTLNKHINKKPSSLNPIKDHSLFTLDPSLEKKS